VQYNIAQRSAVLCVTAIHSIVHRSIIQYGTLQCNVVRQGIQCTVGESVDESVAYAHICIYIIHTLQGPGDSNDNYAIINHLFYTT
jgi:hypothetical protein